MGRPVILDCDTGTDDALAIALAALHPDLDLLGVTTVWGNHEVAHTTDNTLRVLDHLGFVDVPVHAGLAGPYAGRDPPLPGGRADLPTTLDLPPAHAEPVSSTDAVGWLVETLRRGDRAGGAGGHGPVSNLAAALAPRPAPARARRPAGPPRAAPTGAPGVTPWAERNVWCDPEAAAVVLAAAGATTTVVVTMDATYAAAPRHARRRGLGGSRDSRAGTLAARPDDPSGSSGTAATRSWPRGGRRRCTTRSRSPCWWSPTSCHDARRVWAWRPDRASGRADHLRPHPEGAAPAWLSTQTRRRIARS